MSVDIFSELSHCIIGYVESVEGRVFDKVLDFVYEPLKSYIIEGRKPSGDFEDRHAAKLLWLYIFYWGNVYFKRKHKREVPNIYGWIRENGDGVKLVKILKEYRDVLRYIVGDTDHLWLNDKELVSRLEELFNKVKSVKYVGTTAAAKILFMLSGGKLPLLDTAISKCVLGKEVNYANDYIEFIKRMIELKKRIEKHKNNNAEFVSVLQIRTNVLEEQTASGVRKSTFKVIDEGLWFCLVRKFNCNRRWSEECRVFCQRLNSLLRS